MSALKLKNSGMQVLGLYIMMHENYTDSLQKAKQAADQAEIDFDTVDKRDEFKEIVINQFVNEYLKGRTPNPCVICNSNIKIATLCDEADKRGYDFVATGHYARIDKDPKIGRYTVFCAEDGKKDQSYMLWQLNQKQLSKLITPLSNEYKNILKNDAKKVFSAAEYDESQEICFIPSNDYVSFINNYLSAEQLPPPGNFIDSDGKIIGRHKGIHNYTIGQRHGLGIVLGERAFITKIDTKMNDITVGVTGDEFTDTFKADNLNFMVEDIPEYVTVKTRYHSKKYPVKVEFIENYVKVTSEIPLRAITPGQSAVFYKDNMVLFGGLIG